MQQVLAACSTGGLSMKTAPTLGRFALVVGAAALLLLSGTMAWATANDYQSRGLVPNGVTVAGTSLAGMTEVQARAAIERAVSAPLLRPISVEASGQSFLFDPKGVVTVDVDGMLAEAYAPRRTAPLIARVRHDVAGEPLPARVEPQYTVDKAAIASWVASAAAQIDRRPVNAKRTIQKYKLVVIPSVVGFKTDLPGSEQAITDALSSKAALDEASRTATMVVAVLPPKVTEKSFKKTLVVSLSQRKVRLYNGAKLEKTYPIAIGTASYPTPTGDWKIINKRFMPTWTNPGSGWAASMPAYIAPGPGNPLGTRALDLDASGIRFHGTSNIGSVGTAASHGCMRMYMHDIEALYPLVPVGTPVYIRS
jgi:lipoprotein-anchoring transpeptidase ErfK/SrfK